MDKELKAVKILLETGEFDKEMDADEKKFNEVSKNPENDRSKNINNIKSCVDRNTVENELKILLEAWEFDSEMDIDEKKSNEASKNQENENSRTINNIKMFIQKN